MVIYGKNILFKGIATALAAMGICSDHVWLPLFPLEDGNREKLLAEMRAQGILT